MTPTRSSDASFIKNLKQLFLLHVLAASSIMAAGAGVPDNLEQQFQIPPRRAQPWVYWVWLDTDIPRATITRDLEEMKAKGIAGCILYGNQSGHWSWPDKLVFSGKDKDYRPVRTDEYTNSYMTPMPPLSPLVTWSPHWRSLVCFSAKECARLGLSFVVCDGLANTSGPIAEEYGEQKLVWAEASVHGPQTFDRTLPEPLELGKKSPHSKPKRYHLLRDVAVLAVPDQDGFSTNKIVNLTAKIDGAEHLHWAVPEGSWKIIRFAQTPTGTRNAWGFYTDSMSAEALDKTWDVTMAPLLKEMAPEEHKALKGIEDDSWEAGTTTWTKLFPEDFRKRRGYDLIPFLPIIAGMRMSDEETRQRVLRDYKLTISDLIVDNHYAHLKKLANDNGLICYSEAAGPNYDQADVLKTSSRVDVGMAEFWMPSTHRPSMDSRFLLRNAASANHIYGNNITMCEAFTSLGPEWEETPFTMKPVADQAFCDGLNSVCIHNFSQSPSLTAKPGYVYCAGTHYEPGMSWWDETPAFNTYLGRCSAMLQAGKYVADAILYHGDNIGKGEARKKIPPTLGEGYDHDNCNSEVLLTRMSVRDGRIVLPDGMSYRVMVLPSKQAMPFADLEKLSALVENGATIVGPPPAGMAGMPLNSDVLEKFNALAGRLWGGMDGTNVTRKQVGAGWLYWGPTARQVLQDEGVPPDFEQTGLSDAGTLDWIHRASDDVDIYYVASRCEHPEKIDCTFRVSGRQPELWDPVTGKIRDAMAFHQKNSRTVVPLEFNPCGSVFVVFRKPISPDLSGTKASNYPSVALLTTLSGPWSVNFDQKWGGPEKAVVFDPLMDWTKSPEIGIKYYSGKAVYHKRFYLDTPPAAGKRVILDLGDVHEVATVRLNGKDLGVVWTKPARVDITDAVEKDNDLEVAIVNLWPNRLSHDESLPKESRLTESNIHKFVPASPLLPSGLIGPVNLLTEEVPLSR